MRIGMSPAGEHSTWRSGGSARQPEGGDGGRFGMRRATEGSPHGRPARALRGSVPTARSLLLLLVALLGLAAPALAAPALANDVKLELLTFGVGNAARPGEWIGIKVKLTSVATDVKTVEMVWELPNADGDIVENSRTVNLSAGASVERWIYGRLPPNSQAQVATSTASLIRLYEVDANKRRIADLGATPISGSTATTAALPVDQLTDMAMVLGDVRVGLDSFAPRGGMAGAGVLPSLNSSLAVVDGVGPRDLCDRWEGLSQYSTIVWCDGTRLPGQLETAQAEALRQWIRRGGTFVIGLAADGAADVWGNATTATHRLADLLPSTSPQRVEGVLIAELLPLLSKSSVNNAPTAKTNLFVFDPQKLDRGFRPMLAVPATKAPTTGLAVRTPGSLDGSIIGVQRNLGFGQVIILGIDVDGIYRRTLQRGPVPQGDIFWNAILGRRGDTPTPEEIQILDDDNKLYMAQPNVSSLGSGETMAAYIGMAGSAALSVLSAAGLFGAYWLLSGPIGFAGLKQFKRERHSWLLFVVFAFLFTALAWVGGAVLGKTSPSIQHLTVIDQLAVDPSQTDATAGAPLQRATAYFSAYLPGYSPTLVTVADEERQGNILSSWSKPPSGTGDSFPNKDRYRVSYDDTTAGGETPSSYRVPARSTSADFIARWMGAVPTSWGELIKIESPIDVQLDRTTLPNTIYLRGAISHRLPGDLTQVRIIVVTPYRRPLTSFPANAKLPMPMPDRSGQMPLYGFLFSLDRPLWKPGQAIEFDELVGGSSLTLSSPVFQLQEQLEKLYRDPILNQLYGAGITGESLSDDSRRRYLESLSLYSMLAPPEWLQRAAGATVAAARAEREHARELDLSPWLTRPCIIVMGFLDRSPIPVPVEIDGGEVESTGTTLYRWIYPLDGYGWSAPSDTNYRDLVVPDRREPAAPPPPEAPAPPGDPADPAAAPTAPADPAASPTSGEPPPPADRPSAIPAPGRRRGT